MTQEDKRKEVLDLLARGKITIEEAVTLLDVSVSGTVEEIKEVPDSDGDPPLKVEVPNLEEVPGAGVTIEEIPVSKPDRAVKQPRWLRIHVGDLSTGKSKVKVNIPFGMVKFGLGMARIFAPGDYAEDLDDITSLMAEADSGLLVDVQDAESNEHVRIYFE